MVGAGLNSVHSQERTAAARTAGNLDLLGLFREAKLGGDRLVGHAPELAKDEDFTTTGGQGIDGGGGQDDFIAFAGSLRGTRPSLRYDGLGGPICHAVDGRDPISPGRVDHEVPRTLEHERLRIADGLPHAHRQSRRNDSCTTSSISGTRRNCVRRWTRNDGSCTCTSPENQRFSSAVGGRGASEESRRGGPNGAAKPLPPVVR